MSHFRRFTSSRFWLILAATAIICGCADKAATTAHETTDQTAEQKLAAGLKK